MQRDPRRGYWTPEARRAIRARLDGIRDDLLDVYDAAAVDAAEELRQEQRNAEVGALDRVLLDRLMELDAIASVRNV